jgi:hypothetical protein
MITNNNKLKDHTIRIDFVTEEGDLEPIILNKVVEGYKQIVAKQLLGYFGITHITKIKVNKI